MEYFFRVGQGELSLVLVEYPVESGVAGANEVVLSWFGVIPAFDFKLLVVVVVGQTVDGNEEAVPDGIQGILHELSFMHLEPVWVLLLKEPQKGVRLPEPSISTFDYNPHTLIYFMSFIPLHCQDTHWLATTLSTLISSVPLSFSFFFSFTLSTWFALPIICPTVTSADPIVSVSSDESIS